MCFLTAWSGIKYFQRVCFILFIGVLSCLWFVAVRNSREWLEKAGFASDVNEAVFLNNLLFS